MHDDHTVAGTTSIVARLPDDSRILPLYILKLLFYCDVRRIING